MIWHLYRVELNQGGLNELGFTVIDSINVYINYYEILQHENNSCTRTYAVGALARFNKSPAYRSCKVLVRADLSETTKRDIQFTESDFELF